MIGSDKISNLSLLKGGPEAPNIPNSKKHRGREEGPYRFLPPRFNEEVIGFSLEGIATSAEAE